MCSIDRGDAAVGSSDMGESPILSANKAWTLCWYCDKGCEFMVTFEFIRFVTKSVGPQDGGILKASIKWYYVARVIRMRVLTYVAVEHLLPYPRAESELRSHKGPLGGKTKFVWQT